MNVKKTKSMVFSRNKDIPKLKLLINGNEIEQVKSFQYLGGLVTEDGRCECELNRRIAVAKNNFSKMSRILTDHDMSLATKIRLAQCYVWSSLLYGCETWSLTQTNEMKLRGFEMWMYRRIGRVSWKAKKTNKEVLNKLGLQSTKLMTIVEQRIVRFYGHVRRHDRNEHKQMRRNCYQQGRMEDHSIQRRVRQGTAMMMMISKHCPKTQPYFHTFFNLFPYIVPQPEHSRASQLVEYTLHGFLPRPNVGVLLVVRAKIVGCIV